MWTFSCQFALYPVCTLIEAHFLLLQLESAGFIFSHFVTLDACSCIFNASVHVNANQHLHTLLLQINNTAFLHMNTSSSM